MTVRLVLLLVGSIASVVAAAESDADLPNWVSPINASDPACYRKTYLSSDPCATGYGSDGIAACWAQCPLDYPVECGMECIPQSSDCTSEVVDKVASVATVALNAATAGVFGQLSKASKALQLGVKCGQKLFAATSSLVSYVDELQSNTTQQQQLLGLVNQSDLVINELPAAICTCLGLPISADTLELSAEVAGVVNQVVTAVVENGASLLDPSTFLAFMGDVGVDGSIQDLDTDSLTQLQDVLTAGTTCGTKLQTIIHKVTQFVAAIKDKNPSSTVSNIRQALSVSELFLTDIPAVTNNCIRNLTSDAFNTRDSLRTVMSSITDGLVDGTVNDDGDAISTAEYLASVADMGLDVIATLDPTGIADMMATYIQPICGPTAFIGEIDDGSLADALALITEDVAFDGSYGTWSKTGDGTVNITFESTDSEDVTVVIHSGGDTVAEVDVASGATVSWNSTVISLQDKTLYLDRWRPGLLGVRGSGGGSLLLWVPRSSAGGEIELYAKLNGDGGDSREGSSSSSNVEQDDGNDTNGSQIDSSKDGVATPAPTTFTDENQTDQRPISGEDDDNSTESNATPAPTTSVDESATPAPTSLDDENATPAPSTSDTLKTAQRHQPATIRFHITSHGSSKIKLQVN